MKREITSEWLTEVARKAAEYEVDVPSTGRVMPKWVKVQTFFIDTPTEAETMELASEVVRKAAKLNNYLVLWDKPIEVRKSRLQPGVALLTFFALDRTGSETYVIEQVDLKESDVSP